MQGDLEKKMRLPPGGWGALAQKSAIQMLPCHRENRVLRHFGRIEKGVLK